MAVRPRSKTRPSVPELGVASDFIQVGGKTGRAVERRWPRPLVWCVRIA
jgi:hypothetical protein